MPCRRVRSTRERTWTPTAGHVTYEPARSAARRSTRTTTGPTSQDRETAEERARGDRPGHQENVLPALKAGKSDDTRQDVPELGRWSRG